MGAIQQALLMVAPAAGGPVGQAPTDIASNTGWWDFTQSSLLFESTRTTNVSADGDPIQWAEAHDDGSANHLVIFRNNVNGIGDHKTSIVNGKSVARLDDATQSIRGDFKYYRKSDLADLGAIPSTDLLSASGKTIVMAISIASASTASVNGYGNNPIWGDTGNRFQIGCGAFDATHVTVRPYNYDGSEDTVSIQVPRNQFGVLTVWHDGTNLKVRWNRGSWSSVASGSTASFAGDVTTGQLSVAGVTNFDWVHLASFNAALTDGGDLDDVEDYMANEIGVSL